MYKVLISTQAEKGIFKLKALYQDEVLQILKELKEDPFMGKRLERELHGRLSIRIDVYRIIYSVNEKDKVVRILSTGHRAIVYKKR